MSYDSDKIIADLTETTAAIVAADKIAIQKTGETIVKFAPTSLLKTYVNG